MKHHSEPSEVLKNKIYQKVLDEIDIGIHVVNAEGKTIIYNKKMMEIESMEKEDVLNKDLLDVFSFEQNSYSTLIEALHNGKIIQNIKQRYYNNKGK
ncbi:MAG TPA: PAS domain-containing protein, partial [Pseudoneobacillus sp.]|nr:PAS domain-containing protein [Pseudoneobacillus sp.]